MQGIYQRIEGSNRFIDLGADLDKRLITVPFYIQSEGAHDFALLRDELFGMVISKEPFYIRELRRNKYPDGVNQLVGGKQYKVRVTGGFDLDQTVRYGFGEMVFETTELPFAESIGSTQDIQRDGISIDSELWGYGMGLLYDDESTIYTHNAIAGRPFRIYNAGNVPIHPFEQKLKITITNVQGSSSRFLITNETNGSRSRINVPIQSSNTIVYDGPNVTRNNLAFLRSTDKNFIELSPGWNVFRITDCDIARIEFDFPFYYL